MFSDGINEDTFTREWRKHCENIRKEVITYMKEEQMKTEPINAYPKTPSDQAPTLFDKKGEGKLSITHTLSQWLSNLGYWLGITKVPPKERVYLRQHNFTTIQFL